MCKTKWDIFFYSKGIVKQLFTVETLIFVLLKFHCFISKTDYVGMTFLLECNNFVQKYIENLKGTKY